MATRFGKLALVLLATLMLVMTGCSSEVDTAAADKAAQNVVELADLDLSVEEYMKLMMPAVSTLGIEINKLSPSEQKAWEKKWGKKLDEAGINGFSN